MFSRVKLRVFSVLSAIFSVVLLFISINGPATFPDQHRLTWVNGRAERVVRDEYGVNFGLSGNTTDFFYAQKGGEVSFVLSALSSPDSQPISVAYDPLNPNQGLDTGKFYNVYELRAPSHVVRSYDQIRKAWMGDYKIAYFLVAWFALSSIFLWRASIKL